MNQLAPTLDEVDRRLLALLQDDASRSNQALAEAAGISPATALRRVRRLVDEGVIERQVALVSPAVLPDSLTAIVEITLDRQGAEHQAAFESRVRGEAAVQQCYRIASGPDFVLVLWVPGMAAYQALVQRLFTQDANVRNVRAFFSLQRTKFEPRMDFPSVSARG
jgi:DNA-binding Lrp family transcriptional regulator